jgi:hypothetical protein
VRRHDPGRLAADGHVAVARRHGSVHAQVASCAELALGTHAQGVNPAVVRRRWRGRRLAQREQGRISARSMKDP